MLTLPIYTEVYRFSPTDFIKESTGFLQNTFLVLIDSHFGKNISSGLKLARDFESEAHKRFFKSREWQVFKQVFYIER